MGRNILAVIAGIVSWGILSTILNLSLQSAMPGSFDEQGFTREAGLLVLIIGFSVICSLVAGFVSATLARGDRARVVLVLAIIELGIGIAVQASVWERAPLWYHLVFLALVVPAHLLGGRLCLNRQSSPVAA